MKPEARILIHISGFVQGVFFRYAAKEFAEKNNLAGYVKNSEDGRVEIAAEGSKENLKKILEWSHTGPDLAKVQNVSHELPPATGEFKGFAIR